MCWPPWVSVPKVAVNTLATCSIQVIRDLLTFLELWAAMKVVVVQVVADEPECEGSVIVTARVTVSSCSGNATALSAL